MLLCYRLCLLLLTPVILLFLLLRSRSNPAYRQRLAERFGWYPSSYQQGGIVIHAASVGEVLALKNLVEKLLIAYPDTAITFTTFTPTGSEQVKNLFDDRVQHCYLPLDIFFASALFLQKIKPKLMIFMETELWPDLVAQAKQRNIKLLLINGRISKRSLNSYQKLQWLIAPCLQKYCAILSQSEENQKNFLTLGAQAEQCRVSGNLKYDMLVSDNVINKQGELRKLIPESKKIWVVASTHQGDELLALKAFSNLKTQFSDLLLVIVPRHPERFNAVEQLAHEQGFITQKRSSQQSVNDNCQVWVLDTLGELMALYGLADVVTIGGSFSHIGGHNPLEPAWFKKAIIVGPNMENFTDIMQQMLEHQAIIQLPDNDNFSESLSHAVADVIKKPNLARQYGEQAHHVVSLNQGAVDKTRLEIALLMK